MTSLKSVMFLVEKYIFRRELHAIGPDFTTLWLTEEISAGIEDQIHNIKKRPNSDCGLFVLLPK